MTIPRHDSFSWRDTPSLRHSQHRTRRVLTMLLVIAVLGIGSLTWTSPVSAQAAYGWAYLLADQPTTASYTPDTALQFNSTGGSNTVERTNVGIYSVTLPGFGEDGGTYQVTAVNAGFAICNLASWTTGASVQVAEVRCFDATGAFADSAFSLSYLSGPTPIGVGSFTAYLFANQPTTDAYSPDPTFQYNSLGHENTMKRSEVGVYTATLPGNGQLGGIPQVTAVGPDAGACKLGSWGGIGTGQEVRVSCFDRSGAPADRLFFLTFVQAPATGNAALAVVQYSAYFFADALIMEPSPPVETNRFLSGPGEIQIIPLRAGIYFVQMPDVGVGGGHVQVTAVGNDPTTCVVVGWEPGVTAPTIGLHCYDATGTLVNSAFTLSFIVG